MDRSIAFYTHHLGFTVDQQRPPAFAQVSLGGLTLVLSGPGSSGARPMPDGQPQEPGGWRWARAGGKSSWKNPDGNPIELFEPAR